LVLASEGSPDGEADDPHRHRDLACRGGGCAARQVETPIAVVALKEGAQTTSDDLISYARERLAHFKCPTRVEYVPELPRNAPGKVLKTTLRKEYGGQETTVQR
jgi:acyl-CoA synthetase (AMP-forming)/AMP-acid ligase II